MNICVRVSIEYKMPLSEVRRCLTIKFTICFVLAAVAVAQSPDTNSISGPLLANGGSAAEFREFTKFCDFILTQKKKKKNRRRSFKKLLIEIITVFSFKNKYRLLAANHSYDISHVHQLIAVKISHIR